VIREAWQHDEKKNLDGRIWRYDNSTFCKWGLASLGSGSSINTGLHAGQLRLRPVLDLGTPTRMQFSWIGVQEFVKDSIGQRMLQSWRLIGSRCARTYTVTPKFV
jgi:hypothetical protein